MEDERGVGRRRSLSLFFASLAFVAGLLACPRDPVTPEPMPDLDASAYDASIPPTCEAWCAHAKEIGCAAAKDTPGGVSCERVCDNYQTHSPVVWNLACRVNAATCQLADNCERIAR